MTLLDKTTDLVNRVVANNIWRQRECVNLIPSENTPSLLVKMLEISDPAGRYAEHRTMKGEEIYFYQGTDFIREIEKETRKEICEYVECSEVEVRTISGQMTNRVVFDAMVRFLSREKDNIKTMRCVMNNALTMGGHLSSQPMGALFNCVDKVVNFPVMKDNPYKIDTARLTELITDNKPDLIIFGKSMFIYPEPVEFVAETTRQMAQKPVLMYDMAHTFGLYGEFQRPLQEGADILTASTHKTFAGPQRGIICSNMDKEHPYRKLWLDIKNRVFPGFTSNHHLGTLLGLLGATYEMNAFKKEYQEEVRTNAKSFAKSLKSYGIDVEGDERDGFTETHQVLLRVRKYGTGEEIAKRLEENNIIVNYQALPDDKSFIGCSGIRTGIQEMTRFGMKEKDFDTLAGYIKDIIIHNKSVKEDVKKFREKFLDMRYCLPEKDAVSLASKILASISISGLVV